MDKRLELTEKQKEIVSRYEAIIEEMKEAKIKGVFKFYDDVCLFNGEQVEDVFFEEEDNDLSVRVDTDDCYCAGHPCGLFLGYNENFRVQFAEPAD